MKERIIVLLGAVGFFSGVMSYLLANAFQESFVYIPGAVFGVAIGAYFLAAHPKSKLSLLIPRLILWVFVSTVAYRTAVQTAVHFAQNGSLGFLGGGAVGSLIMLLGFHFFISPLSLNKYIFLAALGSVLGLSGYLSFGDYSLLLLYLFWQTGMAMALGYVFGTRGHGRS